MTKIGDVNGLIAKLDKLANVDLTNALEKCGIAVRDTAKQNVKSQEIKSNLQCSKVEDNSIVIGTNVEYAPYVEIGTGIYAGVDTNGMYSQYIGTGRKTWWVYVKNGDPELKGTGRKPPFYTYDEAVARVAALKAQGLDAHMSQGMRAQPFLQPALLENRELVGKILGAEIIKEAK